MSSAQALETEAARRPAAKRLVTQCMNEFLGCTIFLCAICTIVNFDHPLAPLAIGSTLMCIIYAGGHVSGGHYNPAVSIGIFIRDAKFDIMSMACYIVAQCAGAILGAVLAYALMGDGQSWMAEMKQETGYSAIQVILAEFIFCFLLVWTVLNVATSDAAAYQNNSFFALAIGFTVVVGASAVGGITGGAFNPAVALGVEVGTALGDKAGHKVKFILHIIGDVLGGIVAGVWYRFIVVPYHASE